MGLALAPVNQNKLWL